MSRRNCLFVAPAFALLLAPLSLTVGLTVLTIGSSESVAQTDPWTIYLNRCAGGCEVFADSNNAREPFRSTIVPVEVSPVTLPEFTRGDAVWDQVVECVQHVYAPYNVVVTDQEPAPTSQYHMAIVAGTGSQINRPQAGGVGLGACSPQDNAISFTFDIWGSNPDLICGVIAQETAHTFGLDHELNCASPMTYLDFCGRTFFRDVNLECGEFSARDCRCSGPAQNSHRWLLGKLGTNPVTPPGPDVLLDSPKADAMVNDGFIASTLVTDLRGIGRVEFWVNGTLMHTVDGPEVGTSQGPAYNWTTPATLAGGIIDLEVKAYNDIDSETIETVTFQKGAPCATEATCSAGQFCEDGRCKFPIATGEIGDECVAATDCMSGLCPLEGDTGLCSEECDPGSILAQCPSGFECRAGGASGFCWPESSGGGCGCQAGSGTGAPLGGFLLLLGVVVALRRRR